MHSSGRPDLFSDLTDDQYEALINDAPVLTLNAGEYLVLAGDQAETFYLIESGNVAIEVVDPNLGEQHIVSHLGAGDVVGEMALLDSSSRSASVVASSDLMVRSINVAEETAATADMALKLYLNLGGVIAKRLRTTTTSQASTMQAHLEECEHRVEIGTFLGNILICTFLYTFTLCALKALSEFVPASTFVTIPVLAMFGGVIFYVIRRSNYPLEEYGLTTKGAGAAIREAILFSLPVLLLVVGVKFLLINTVPSMQHMDLFGLSAIRFLDDPEITFGLTVAVVGGYLLFSPVQEFVVRCGLQSSFDKFMSGRFKTPLSIVVATMLFSATHLHVSFVLAVIVFPLGLFWGWLYSRHPTLFGVSASHMLIGFFGLFIVEFHVN